MSERLTRLTDADLQAIDASSSGRDGTGVSRLTTRMMLSELRDRRAADLTDEERDNLTWLRERIHHGGMMNPHARHAVSILSALDKLLGDKP